MPYFSFAVDEYKQEDMHIVIVFLIKKTTN